MEGLAMATGRNGTTAVPGRRPFFPAWSLVVMTFIGAGLIAVVVTTVNSGTHNATKPLSTDHSSVTTPRTPPHVRPDPPANRDPRRSKRASLPSTTTTSTTTTTTTPVSTTNATPPT